MIKNIGIIGLGYVGLTTSVGFASLGYKVIGIDVIEENVERINSCQIPFFEPRVPELLQDALEKQYFKASTNYDDLIGCKIIFICVGTPSKEGGESNLTYIEDAAIAIGKTLKKMDNKPIIIVKSTVPPDTTQFKVLPLLTKYSNKKIGIDFSIAMSPEFLKEGTALNDFLKPDRIIIGAYDEKTTVFLSDFFKIFKTKIFVTKNISTAEMIKYANNAFLSTKISFINEIANICRGFENIDVDEIAKGIGMDERISDKFLRAGCGFGGSCYPKDVKSLISFAKNNGYNASLLKSVLVVNENQAKITIQILKEAIPDLTDKKIAILGLAFKPETSDMREACSIRIINLLQKEKIAKITVYDPKAIEEAKKIFNDTVIYAKSAEDCISGADTCIVVTEWDEFKKLKPDFFKKYMKAPILIDSRKMYNCEEFSKQLPYYEIGRR
ncbi:MAG: UDP-glucose dehydrogenase family protein [Candidatus Helarchaeota archaeon]